MATVHSASTPAASWRDSQPTVTDGPRRSPAATRRTGPAARRIKNGRPRPSARARTKSSKTSREPGGGRRPRGTVSSIAVLLVEGPVAGRERPLRGQRLRGAGKRPVRQAGPYRAALAGDGRPPSGVPCVHGWTA